MRWSLLGIMLTGLLGWNVPSTCAASYCTGANLIKEDDAWLRSPTGSLQLAHLLTYQTPAGGWCKAYNAHNARDVSTGPAGYGGWKGTPTIDNGATYSEIRLLGRAFTATAKAEYQQACLRGLTFLLERQYDTGGWPQRSPKDPGEHDYGTHITFNDNAMTEVMTLLEDIVAKRPEFAWMPEEQRRTAQAAFIRGIDCILKCQHLRAGTLTAWCQQHDAVTLAPTTARKYELPSLASSESARIITLLMRIPQPDERIRRSIEAAHTWFSNTQISGKRVSESDDDRVLIDDPKAEPLWARFYDLDHDRAFFCDRDGVKHNSWNDISRERRTGYAWYGTWGEKVLRDYPRWRERIATAP